MSDHRLLDQPATDDLGGGLIRLRLDIAYDGAEFHGWAAQRGEVRTVQGVLEHTLTHLFGEPVNLTCAGRTDAGVHARGQVAHVDVAAWPPAIDAARVNRALPADVRVTSIREVSADFDARFAAMWRRYTYRVSDDPRGPDPLTRSTVLEWPRPLDLAAMSRAGHHLLGEHDFAALCKARDFATTIRDLQELRWERDDFGVAVMTVRADAFCHSMVRSLVGVLLPVGDGRRAEEWPSQVLAAGVRDPAVTVMPAHALVLEEVGYPDPEHWADRQGRTRSRRDA